MRPDAGDEHRPQALRAELQNNVLRLLASAQLAAFHLVPVDVLIEGFGQEDAVVAAELALPEPFEVVAAGVVAAGELLVVEGRLADRTALEAHQAHDALAVLGDHDRSVGAGVDAIVLRQGLGALQVGELVPGPVDLLLGDALVFAVLLGELELQLFLGFDEPGSLFEQGALMDQGLALAVFGNELLDLALFVVIGWSKAASTPRAISSLRLLCRRQNAS